MNHYNAFPTVVSKESFASKSSTSMLVNVRLQRSPAYKEQFLLHLVTRSKQGPVYFRQYEFDACVFRFHI